VVPDADPTNDVYRAWQRLRDRSGHDRPAVATPREHAEAAVETGLDGDAVDRVTGLFARVRYGGASATAERERRATAAAARLTEDAGAGGVGEADTDGGGQRRSDEPNDGAGAEGP
jgi:hypothetical protein